jgi:hypothetical protein
MSEVSKSDLVSTKKTVLDLKQAKAQSLFSKNFV